MFAAARQPDDEADTDEHRLHGIFTHDRCDIRANAVEGFFLKVRAGFFHPASYCRRSLARLAHDCLTDIESLGFKIAERTAIFGAILIEPSVNFLSRLVMR